MAASLNFFFSKFVPFCPSFPYVKLIISALTGLMVPTTIGAAAFISNHCSQEVHADANGMNSRLAEELLIVAYSK
jgi:hypothetical protein